MYFLQSRSDSSPTKDPTESHDAARAIARRARRSCGALPALGIAAAAIVAFAFPPEAHAAGEKDWDALELHDQAMDEDYRAVELAKAEKKLKDALKTCGADGCTPKVLGKLHIAMGTVHGANGRLDLAKEELIAALKVDSEATLNERLTTPELAKAFKEAQKAAGVSAKPAGEKLEKPTGDGEATPRKPAGTISHTPPAGQAMDTPVPIYIELPEEVGATKVTLHYKPFGGTKWKTLQMPRVEKGYGVEIPCDDVRTTGDIEYFIIANDDAGAPAGTAGSMKEPYKVPIKNKIDGDAPSLPGKKPPKACAAKKDCPPGQPGCPGYPPPGYSSRYEREERPEEIPYIAGDQEQKGYHLESRSRKGPVIAGAIVFGVTYGGAAILGAGTLGAGNEEGALFFLPIAGPIIFGALLLGAPQPSDSSGLGGIRFGVGMISLLDGLAQATGGILLTVGLASPAKKVWVLGPPEARSTTPRLAFTGDRIVLEGNF